jgi:hypothetical protein
VKPSRPAMPWPTMNKSRGPATAKRIMDTSLFTVPRRINRGGKFRVWRLTVAVHCRPRGVGRGHGSSRGGHLFGEAKFYQTPLIWVTAFTALRNGLNGGRELGYEASLLSAVGLCASAPKQPPLNLPTQVHALATATKALATSGPKLV